MKICKSLSDKARLCPLKINFSISPDSIPTLISNLDILTENDPKPYFIVEEIFDIKELANGVEFTAEFWDSYIKKLNQAPFPGSKSGHTYRWGATGDMDFYTIGAKRKKDTVFLKMYIPPEGYKNSNETFIKAVKAGMVHFSIVSWTEDIIEMDADGSVKSIKAVRSVKGERNDAVERNMGAMDQEIKVNKDGDEIPDQIKTEVKYIMSDTEYKPMIENLKNRCANGSLSLERICKDLGFEILTKEHKEKLQTMEEIKKLSGENPIEAIKAMKSKEQEVKQQSYDNTREKLMHDEFGPAGTEEKPNLKREAAEPLVNKEIQTEDELKKQVEKAKENPVVKNMSFQHADVNSASNDITGVSVKNNSGKQYRTTEKTEV